MFRWSDFLTLSERLSLAEDDEAALRTAISRAYYAAYHEAAAFVRSEGILRRKHSHQAIWGALATSSEADLVEIANRGANLKRLRTAADYRAPFPGDLPALCRDAVAEARAVIDLLAQQTSP